MGRSGRFFDLATETAESILVARGASILVVASGNRRAHAHAFYEKNGYTFTGRRYEKIVDRERIR
jgi:ribosomal protein S18 acetylase RimI-like enzyme